LAEKHFSLVNRSRSPNKTHAVS